MSLERILQVLSLLIGVFVVVFSGALFLFGGNTFLSKGNISPTNSRPSDVSALGLGGQLTPLKLGTSTGGALSNKKVVGTSTTISTVIEPHKTVHAPEPPLIRKTQTKFPVLPVETTTDGLSSSTTESGGEVSVSEKGPLDRGDILSLTNVERVRNGLSPLSYNEKLTTIAKAKALDMINLQYFAHVSPGGEDVADLALRYGYAYLNIGENLAMGDFASSADVVSGWMNSPGHRANILHANYKEIGVSAILGEYEGRKAWFAVQEFGRPMSDCISPSAILKEKITSDRDQLDALELALAKLKSELEVVGQSVTVHNAQVDDFNTLVAFHNDLVAKVKSAIREYNTGVDAYNTCATGK